ncbi:hypothetical protein LWI28_022039 [Acer negundo]|uniref:Uncharacterized protein n=1 Tax=Acer negundo TaxID=4023 RepID=A0AAD5NSZ9_ACENE|nr:hypothetical protein LWI28_022039 [Acer negundo]
MERTGQPQLVMSVSHVGHMWAEMGPARVPHVAHTWPCKAHPAPSGPLSLASTEKAQRRGKGSRNDNPAPIPPPITAACPLPRDLIGQEINRDILKQQAADYLEAIRLRMIAQGIPFEAARISEDISPSIRVLLFDRLGPSPPNLVCQVNLRPRLVKSAIEILPRRVQPLVRLRGEKKDPQPDSEGSARS